MKLGIMLILWVTVPLGLLGQEADSLTLSLSDVLALAKKHHPIVQQAMLQDEFAEAELKAAKGTLDPKLQSGYQLKELKGTTYYDKFYNALKVPLWFPIDPKVEVYHHEGDFLNPESQIKRKDNWQVAAGVSIPIGQGLFIDERRNQIKQARIFGDLASAEKLKLLNKTYFTIAKAYWEWYMAYEKAKLYTNSLQIAEEILRRTRLDYGYGEAAVIDTIQALISYQSQQVAYEKAKQALGQSRLSLSLHLWGEDLLPLELASGTRPSAEANTDYIPTPEHLDSLAQWGIAHHPEVKKLEAKLAQLDVERKWNMEMLKPEINLSYSLIDAPVNPDREFTTPKWDEDFKLGMDFYFPLFLRKERGKLQKTRTYIESYEYDLLIKKQEINNTIRATYLALVTNQQLAMQYQAMAANYSRLLDAEILNLQLGESDLFKLNIQQEKYLNAQIKYIEALGKYRKMLTELPYEIGLPHLSYEDVLN